MLSASTSRLPRTYRGRDIYRWLAAIGQLDERYDEVEDIERARRHASVQLVGTPTRMSLDLNTLSGRQRRPRRPAHAGVRCGGAMLRRRSRA